MEQTNATIARLAVIETLRMCGISSCEITKAEARRRFGRWFVYATERGDLKPSRIGRGKTGTQYFRVDEILALQDQERTAAELILRKNITTL